LVEDVAKLLHYRGWRAEPAVIHTSVAGTFEVHNVSRWVDNRQMSDDLHVWSNDHDVGVMMKIG
jgi:hypothetical protein